MREGQVGGICTRRKMFILASLAQQPANVEWNRSTLVLLFGLHRKGAATTTCKESWSEFDSQTPEPHESCFQGGRFIQCFLLTARKSQLGGFSPPPLWGFHTSVRDLFIFGLSSGSRSRLSRFCSSLEGHVHQRTCSVCSLQVRTTLNGRWVISSWISPRWQTDLAQIKPL